MRKLKRKSLISGCAYVALAAGVLQGCASFPTMSVAPEQRQEDAQLGPSFGMGPGGTGASPANIMEIPGIAQQTRQAPVIPAATAEQIAALVPAEPLGATLPAQPLAQYLNTVFTQVLKVPYSLGPDIGSRNTIITVNAPPTIDKRAYVALLQNTLRNYGLAMAIQNNAVLITDSVGPAGGVGVGNGGRPTIIRSRSSADTPVNGRVVQVFQLLSLQASQDLVNLAQRVSGFGGGASIQVDPASNALTVEGQGRQVAAMIDILRNLDQPAYAGAQVARLEPIYQSPTDFAYNLQAALAAEGFVVSSDPLGPKSIMILPLVSTNQTLVFAADKAAMARVQFWAKEIDAPTAQGDTSTTFVYEVRNTSATTIGQLLVNAWAQTTQNRPNTNNNQPGVIVTAPNINAIQPNLNQQQQARPGQQAQQAQQARPGQTNQPTQATTSNARPGGAQTAQVNRPGQTNNNLRAIAGQAPNGGSIAVDDAGNRILFTGSAMRFAQLRGLLERLDVPAREVLIEVTVAEVTLTDETRAGLEFFFNASYNGWPVSGGTGSFPAPAAPFPGAGTGLSGGGLAIGNTGATLNITNPAGDLRAAFNAFASNNKVNVLSRPHLTARSGSEAMIQVGDEVPIITSQRAANTQTGGNTDTLQTVQYRQTGVILTITPVIYGDDRVDVTITQEVSDVRENPNTAIGSPIIGSRVVSTTLSLADGRSAILGGLMEDSFAKGNRGVPFLKDIPILGQAFRTDTVSGRKTELVVLITPMIIRNADDMSYLAAQVTDDINRAFEVGRGSSYTLTGIPLGLSVGIYAPGANVVGGATLQRPAPAVANELTSTATPAPVPTPTPEPAAPPPAAAPTAAPSTQPAPRARFQRPPQPTGE